MIGTNDAPVKRLIGLVLLLEGLEWLALLFELLGVGVPLEFVHNFEQLTVQLGQLAL